MSESPALLDLLLEAETLDRVPRSGYLLRGVAAPESVSEHSFHVAFLVWVLAPRLTGIDLSRALEMALLHDLAEARCGDIPLSAARYFDRHAKDAAEAAAFRDIVAPLGEQAQRAEELFAEYEAATTPEARLVKACDKLQVMLKVSVYEQWGAAGLGEFWGNPANFPDGGFPLVRELFAALRARRAVRLPSQC